MKQILEAPIPQHAKTPDALLGEAVTAFTGNAVRSRSAIRQLQSADAAGFKVAAIRLLASVKESSPGVQFVAGLMCVGNQFIDALLDERILHVDTAVSLARHLVKVEPLLDVRLFARMFAHFGGEARNIKAEVAQRALKLVEALSDGSRLSSYLVQLMQHPSPQVRSKVALVLGRANLNLSRIRTFLGSGDVRLRANAVESMWGMRDPDVLAIFHEAANDPRARVAINGLLGLTLAGDRQVSSRVLELARSDDATVRAGAAWAMGEIGDPEFAPELDRLIKDEDLNVRARAETSLTKLRASGA